MSSDKPQRRRRWQQRHRNTTKPIAQVPAAGGESTSSDDSKGSRLPTPAIPPKPRTDGGVNGSITEDVDLSTQSSYPPAFLTKPADMRLVKENNAIIIARLVLYTFAGSLIGSFIVILILLGFAIFYPALVVDKISPTIGSFLEIIKVVGAIFSPLLAFILGYYFSMTAKSDNS